MITSIMTFLISEIVVWIFIAAHEVRLIIARMREAACFTCSQSAHSGTPDIQDGTMAWTRKRTQGTW